MSFLPPVGNLFKARTPRAVPTALVALFIIIAFGLGWLGGGSFTPARSFPGPSGHVTNTNQPPPAYLSRDVDFSLFWQVWDYIHQNYLERPVSDTKLFYGALQGMVAGLDDPYSVFMDPDTAKSFSGELEGTFDGIGAEIGMKDGKLTIIAPLPGTPADRAGLKPGDTILAIDTTDTTGMAVDYAVSLIRGRKGTSVSLIIQRAGEPAPRTIKLRRARIDVPMVSGELKSLPEAKGQVAYIKLSHFAEETDVRFREVWATMSGKGPKGIILDLRNDPGGYLTQAIAIAGHWVAKGAVVKEQLQPPDFRVHQSEGPGDLAGIPTVVLVNQGSASASEIVTGALQDYKLGTVVGEQTFGKGSVQDLDQLSDGSFLKLTIAKWFTPKGRSIDKNGLKPDIEVKFTKEDVDAGKDPQLARALELLAR